MAAVCVGRYRLRSNHRRRKLDVHDHLGRRRACASHRGDRDESQRVDDGNIRGDGSRCSSAGTRAVYDDNHNEHSDNNDRKDNYDDTDNDDHQNNHDDTDYNDCADDDHDALAAEWNRLFRRACKEHDVALFV
jgi:hypothetical protein